MRYITDEEDTVSQQLDWIHSGDEYTSLSECERLKTIIDRMLGYHKKESSLTFDLNPQPKQRIRFEDVKEGNRTFEVYWEIGGGFTLFELIDSSLDDTPWNAAGAEI